jgi:hypothetical protein
VQELVMRIFYATKKQQREEKHKKKKPLHVDVAASLFIAV